MELYQIFIFYKVEAFHPFITATLSDIIIFKIIFVGNKPNGVESNICFYKVEAFNPFIADTHSENIFFKTIF